MPSGGTEREFRASLEHQGRTSPGREPVASVVGPLIHPDRGHLVKS